MQAALCRRQCHGAVIAPGNQRLVRCKLGSIVRAGDEQGSKVVREFREDSGEMVVPGEQKKSDNALYADQVPQAVSGVAAQVHQVLCVDSAPHSASRPQQSSSHPLARALQLKPKDNISKEMKQRLRQEYYGLGGAENKVGARIMQLPQQPLNTSQLPYAKHRACLPASWQALRMQKCT
jgi:hypothetical protein